MNAFTISQSQKTPTELNEKLNTDGYLFFPKIDKDKLPEFLAQFGCHRTQQDSKPRYIVRAGEKLQPCDGGALMPHTDDFNSERLPPRLVALHCINPGTGKGGETLLADGYGWLNIINPNSIGLLKKSWEYRSGNGESIMRPFFSTANFEPGILRVSFGHLKFADSPTMVKLMEKLLQWFSRVALPVTHQRCSLLLWNNWRMIHGRTNYSDLSRELHRYYLD